MHRYRISKMQWIYLTLGVVFGLTSIGVARSYLRSSTPPQGPAPDHRVSPANPDPKLAWEKVLPHIDQADKDSAESIDRQLRAISAFFDERLKGTRPFGEDAVSFWGKMAFVHSMVPWIGNEKAHERHLDESFRKHLFQPEELESLVKGVLAGYASTIDGLENEVLVKVQADLSDGLLAQGELLTHLKSDELFRAEFRRVADAILPTLNRELGVSVGFLVTSEVAAAVATRVMIAVATRLGVSAGIMGAGGASAPATLGIGLVVSVIVDQALSWALYKAGYDPAGEVAAKTEEQLRALANALIEGERASLDRYQSLRRRADQAASVAEREALVKEAETLAASGDLGLRFELGRQHDLRARLRREALQKVIFAERGE